MPRRRSEHPGRCSNTQNAPFQSINSSLIGENNGIGRRNFSSVQPLLVIEQRSAVTLSRSFTSKFMKAIVPVVEKDAKVFMEELTESSLVIHFSVNNLYL